MRNKILIGMLLVMFLGPVALGFQNTNRRPTPRPSPAASARPSPRPAPATATLPSVVDRVFTWPALIVLFTFFIVAFALGAGAGALALGDNQAAAALRGLEAGILAVVGGLLAGLVIAFLLWLGGDSDAAIIAVGWFFFIVPGAVDTIAYLATGDVVSSPDFLVWLATAIGAFTGLMNGFWQIHDWKGLGWLAFPLDISWGLAGSTIGSLVHVINFAWADHATETRREAHRYNSGFRLKGTFAFTQGPVMSNLPDAPGVPLYHHERTHVWQNRAFGPLFSLTYLGWMAIWVIPGAIAAIVTRDAEAIQSWCYYNNPWETWAYLVGAGPRTGRHPLIWGDLVILLLSLPFFAGVIALMVWIVVEVW